MSSSRLLTVLFCSALAFLTSELIALPPNLKISDVTGYHAEFDRLRTQYRSFRTGEQELRAAQKALSSTYPDVLMSCVEKAVENDRAVAFRTYPTSFHFFSVTSEGESRPWPGVYVFNFSDSTEDLSLLKNYLNASSAGLRKARTEKAHTLAKEEAQIDLQRLSYFSLASLSFTPRREEEETERKMALHFGDADGFFPLLISVVRTPHGYLRARLERLGLNSEVISIAYCESKSVAPTIQVLGSSTRGYFSEIYTPLTNTAYQAQFTSLDSLEPRYEKHNLTVTQKSPFHLTLSGKLFGTPLKWEIVAPDKANGAILGSNADGKVETRFVFSTDETGDVLYRGTALGDETKLQFRSSCRFGTWKLFDADGKMVNLVDTYAADTNRCRHQILINAGLAAANIAFYEQERRLASETMLAEKDFSSVVDSIKELALYARENLAMEYVRNHSSRLTVHQVVELVSQCPHSSRLEIVKLYFNANGPRIQSVRSVELLVEKLPKQHQNELLEAALEVHARRWEVSDFDLLITKSPTNDVGKLIKMYVEANAETLSSRNLATLVRHARPPEMGDLMVNFFSAQASRIDPQDFLALIQQMKRMHFNLYQIDPIILSYISHRTPPLNASDLQPLQREAGSPHTKATIADLVVRAKSR